MTELFKARWFLCLSITIFVLCKIPHLYYPFYWDESWVYAPAVFAMYEHGASLLPDAVPIEFSRGHPLLFHAACAAWMNVFGRSNVALHCFSLLVSVILAIATYELMHRLFNRTIASAALLLLLFNRQFFYESSFVMTDIAVSLFAFVSLYYYTLKRYKTTAFYLSLLFLIKESGMVFGVVIGADAMYQMIKSRQPLAKGIAAISALFVPFVVAGLFYMTQKYTHGWFFYPEHTGMINTDIVNTLYNFQRSMKAVFSAVPDNYFILLPIVAGTFVAIWRRAPVYLLWPVAAVSVYCLIHVFSHKDAIFYAATGSIITGGLLLYKRTLPGNTPEQEKFIKMLAVSCIAYVYFCCINFFEERYLMPVVVFVSVVLCSIVLGQMAQKLNNRWQPYLIAAILCTGVFVSFHKSGEQDAYNRMAIQQDLVDYCEREGLYEQHIYTKSFFELIHLRDPNTGFLHSRKKFDHVTEVINDSTEFLVFDSVEGDDSVKKSIQKSGKFHLVHEYEKETEWVAVFRRKAPHDTH